MGEYILEASPVKVLYMLFQASLGQESSTIYSLLFSIEQNPHLQLNLLGQVGSLLSYSRAESVWLIQRVVFVVILN